MRKMLEGKRITWNGESRRIDGGGGDWEAGVWSHPCRKWEEEEKGGTVNDMVEREQDGLPEGDERGSVGSAASREWAGALDFWSRWKLKREMMCWKRS